MQTLKEISLPLVYCLLSALGGWAMEHHADAVDMRAATLNAQVQAQGRSHEIGVVRSSTHSREKAALTAA
jgi:hypothetical protein